MTIILDIDPQTAAGRLNSQLDRMELKGKRYHEKVREGFLKLASEQSGFVVVDASGDIETTHEKIRRQLDKVM